MCVKNPSHQIKILFVRWNWISRISRWSLKNWRLKQPFAFTTTQWSAKVSREAGLKGKKNADKIEIRNNEEKLGSSVRKRGKRRIGRAVKGIASSRSNVFCWLPSRGDHAGTYRGFSNGKKSLNQMTKRRGRDGDEAKEGWKRKKTGRKALWNFKPLRKEKERLVGGRNRWDK